VVSLFSEISADELARQAIGEMYVAIFPTWPRDIATRSVKGEDGFWRLNGAIIKFGE